VAEKSETYKKQLIRTGLLLTVLGLEIAACAIVFTAFTTGSFNASGHLVIPAEWFDRYNLIANSLSYLPFLAFLCLVFWVFRANKNARAVSTQALEYSPGWAVGWFFVPIASLWKPYQAMVEIYKASRTPHDWRSAKAATLVTGWWCLQVIGNILAISLRFSTMHGQPVNRELAMLFFGVVGVHQILLFVIVTQIDTWQARAHRSGGVEAVF